MSSVHNQLNTLNSVLEALKLSKPVKKMQEAKACLESIHFVILNTVWALREFKAHKFSQFDALVGETACQIRAINIANFAQAYLIHPFCRSIVSGTVQSQQWLSRHSNMLFNLA